MSSDELDMRTHPREDVKVLRLPHSDPNRPVAQRSSSHLMSYYERRRWMSLPYPDEPNRMCPQLHCTRCSSRSADHLPMPGRKPIYIS